jgi:hypothetical protein
VRAFYRNVELNVEEVTLIINFKGNEIKINFEVLSKILKVPNFGERYSYED